MDKIDLDLFDALDEDSTEFWFFEMINAMIDDEKMTHDLRLQLSGVARFINDRACNIDEVVRDSNLAWILYRSIATTELFRNSYSEIAELFKVLDMIRTLYPKWPHLEADEERSARIQSESHMVSSV